jgi:hypothetical protein
MEWHHPQASQKKKLSADKFANMADQVYEGVILLDELPKAEKINSDYVKMLKELKKVFK